MESLFTVILSGMFAAMSFRGSLFNHLEFFVVAILGSTVLLAGIGDQVAGLHWTIIALLAYFGGLASCFAFERFVQYRSQN